MKKALRDIPIFRYQQALRVPDFAPARKSLKPHVFNREPHCDWCEECFRQEGDPIHVEPPTLVDCSHCEGSGKVELTGIYAETLALLKKQSKPLNGAELAKLADCEPTAMNNRLVALKRFGLASFTPYGKEKRWTAK